MVSSNKYVHVKKIKTNRKIEVAIRKKCCCCLMRNRSNHNVILFLLNKYPCLSHLFGKLGPVLYTLTDYGSTH